MLGAFDMWSKSTFFAKKSWKLCFVETEYTKWTEDFLEVEHSFESKSFIGHKTFSDYWNMGEFHKRLQNSTKNNKALWLVDY